MICAGGGRSQKTLHHLAPLIKASSCGFALSSDKVLDLGIVSRFDGRPAEAKGFTRGLAPDFTHLQGPLFGDGKKGGGGGEWVTSLRKGGIGGHWLRPPQGVHVAQRAKRPPLKLEVPGSNPRGWFKRSRWESRPLSLVGNGAGAVTHPTDRAGTVFPRGTGRFLVK